MEENITPRPRKRRRKTKMELFKEAYLPYLILMVAAVLIVIFIIGALVRSASEKKTQQPETAQTTIVEVVNL